MSDGNPQQFSYFTPEDIARAEAETAAYNREMEERDRARDLAFRQKSNAPSILYKYLTPERVDILSGLDFKFTPPHEFGDILDSGWYENECADLNEPGSEVYFLFIDPNTMQILPGEIEKFKRFAEVSESLFPGLRVTAITIPPFRDDRSRKDFLADFRSELRQAVSEKVVFCVSDSRDNKVLWQSYAKGSEGFCIGLRGDAEFFFQGPQTLVERVLYLPDAVTYGSLEVSISRRFLIKHSDFEKEREWRSVIHKSLTKEQMISGRIMYFKRADPSDLAEVVIGSRASPDLIDRIKSMVPPGLPVRRAVIVPGTHNFRFEDF